MIDNHIGFIGLGNVGSKLANSVLEANYNLHVYDIDKKSSNDLVKKGAIWENSIKDIVNNSSLIITCLPSPQAVIDVVENHLISSHTEDFPSSLDPFKEQLTGRSMLVRKCEPLPIECVVRGYLAGSGWKEYQANSTICGIQLASGMKEAEELAEPIFTPSTKATEGHDENINFQEAVELVGEEVAEQVRTLSLALYKRARDHAKERGIIICDTKFEFGLIGSKIILIDEALTPDSSRFWPADQYQPGKSQPSFDKQFVRDYLATLDWDKNPPGPQLPESIITATSQLYLEAYYRLTGESLGTN